MKRISPITPLRRVEAIVFDWDGTAVPDRRADAGEVRALVEQLCATGMDLAIVSGTHVDNIDGQLAARPRGPGHLLLALNRGSEVFRVDESGPSLVERREATPTEDDALDAAAQAIVASLSRRGLETAIVSQRLNRRKIDLIPASRATPSTWRSGSPTSPTRPRGSSPNSGGAASVPGSC